MSSTSGISPTGELTAKFIEAIELKSIRFLKVSIQNESLVHDLSIPISGSFQDDLKLLQDEQILKSDSPAYVLAKLDEPSMDWLAIFYVPDTAKVRDKMLYASTRSGLLKALGSTLFTDSIFATSKADLTSDAYQAHQAHIAAPKPLSSREQEIADLRIAENAAASYGGSSVRAGPIGTGVGLNWSDQADQAVAELGRGDEPAIVILTIDPSSETLVLHPTSPVSSQDLSSALPPSEPCYALFARPYYASSSILKREVVFIYSCPSSSPIKYRMLYSSGSTTTYQAAKTIISSASPSVLVAPRKVETSDPSELDDSFLKAELGRGDDFLHPDPADGTTEKKSFAKPRAPGRRR